MIGPDNHFCKDCRVEWSHGYASVDGMAKERREAHYCPNCGKRIDGDGEQDGGDSGVSLPTADELFEQEDGDEMTKLVGQVSGYDTLETGNEPAVSLSVTVPLEQILHYEYGPESDVLTLSWLTGKDVELRVQHTDDEEQTTLQDSL